MPCKKRFDWINLINKKEEGIAAFSIYNLYDVSQRREFIKCNKTEDKILVNFLNSFDGVRGSHDEVVNFQVDVCISTKKFFTTNGIVTFSIFYYIFRLKLSVLWWKTSLKNCRHLLVSWPLHHDSSHSIKTV